MNSAWYRLRTIAQVQYYFLWLLVSFSIGMSACHRQTKSDALIAPVDTLPPKITKMVIPGIPAENIRIDQIKRQLIVTIPSNLPTYFLSRVQLTMTPGARKLRDFPLRIDLCQGTLDNDSYMAPVTTEDLQYDNHEVIITDGTVRKTYRVQVRPEGPMSFANPGRAFQIQTDGKGDEIDNIAVYNYIDSSGSFGSQVIYTDVKTREEFKRDVEGCARFGEIYIRKPLGLPLGEYAMHIQKKSGRQTTNSLQVNIVSGQFTYYGFDYILNTGRLLTMNVNSVFEGKPARLDIWHLRTGERVALTTFTFDRTGYELKATAPPGLASGYYYSQLTYNGQTSAIVRSVVTKDAKQPRIGPILLSDASTDLARIGVPSITLQRGQTYWGWPSPSDHIKAGRDLQVYFQSVTDPSRGYAIPFLIPPYYAVIPVSKTADYPSYVVPTTMPPGRYMMRIQYVDKDGAPQISDWLERDVEIQ